MLRFMLITLLSAQACLGTTTNDDIAAPTPAPVTTLIALHTNQADTTYPAVKWPEGVNPLETVVFLVGNQTINMDRSLAVEYFNFIEQLHSEGDLDDKDTAMIPLSDLDHYKRIMQENELSDNEIVTQLQEDLIGLIKWIKEFEENKENARKVFDTSGNPRVTLGMAFIADNLNLQNAKELFYQHFVKGLPDFAQELPYRNSSTRDFSTIGSIMHNDLGIALSFAEYNPVEFYDYLIHVRKKLTPEEFKEYIEHVHGFVQQVDITNCTAILLSEMLDILKKIPAAEKLLMRPVSISWFIFINKSGFNKKATGYEEANEFFEKHPAIPLVFDFEYETTVVSAFGCDCFTKRSILPPALHIIIKGDHLTSIGNGFLEKAHHAKRVTIKGDRITSIRDNFLYQSDTLESLVLPDSLITLGNYFLAGARNLKSVDLPPLLTNVGKGLFDRNHEGLVVRAYRTMPAWDAVQEQLGERLQEIPVQETTVR